MILTYVAMYYLISEKDPGDAQKNQRKVRNEDTNITQEDQAESNTEEAREKFKKKGMSEV
jgi:hypothetical protein